MGFDGCALESPALDHPAAATSIMPIGHISDFDQWVSNLSPLENELIYVGQQLWPSFAEFLTALNTNASLTEEQE